MTSKSRKRKLKRAQLSAAARKPLAERHPNGRVKAEPASLTYAQYRREVAAASLAVSDPLLGTQLGWLRRSSRITQAQLEAGMEMAEIYGGYDQAMGCRRAAASPGYEIGRRGLPADGDPARIQAAVEAWTEMQEALGRSSPGAVRLAEGLCVEDRHLMAEELALAIGVLDALAEHFGGRGRKGR